VRPARVQVSKQPTVSDVGQARLMTLWGQ